MNLRHSFNCRADERGSVFILVLWISFGLVVLSLYFANSMSFELRSADNRVAAIEAEHAISGAARYVNHVLTTYATNGAVPRNTYYSADSVPVGDATFWIIGRRDSQNAATTSTTTATPITPVFGLVDESSKLNLNTATADMLATLPGMTVEFAAAIIDWRDTDSTPSDNGAEDEVYQRLTPARRCKNGPFESVDELRLVYGATPEILYGEDANRNGVLDANENDGDVSLPTDNRDSRLDAGIMEYVTVYSRQPNTQSDGTARININTGRAQLQQLLQQTFSAQRAGQIVAQLGPANQQIASVLEFYARSGMTQDEFTQIEGKITTAAGASVQGLINVNTASEAVLACIPGIGVANAPALVAYRRSNPDRPASIAWVKELLTNPTDIQQAGRYLTGQAYQFTADVVALGHHNRGYQRTKFVFDLSGGAPLLRYSQDLTTLGWALGKQVRDNLLQLAKNSKP